MTSPVILADAAYPLLRRFGLGQPQDSRKRLAFGFVSHDLQLADHVSDVAQAIQAQFGERSGRQFHVRFLRMKVRYKVAFADLG